MAFALDDAQLAGLLRCTPAELASWRRWGVPDGRTADVDAVSELATRLSAALSPSTVVRVVRGPVPGGSGWSALDAIAAGHHEQVAEMLAPVTGDDPPPGPTPSRASSEAMRRVIGDLLADDPQPPR